MNERRKYQNLFTISTVVQIVGYVILLVGTFYSSKVSTAEEFAKDRVDIKENQVNVANVIKSQDIFSNTLGDLNAKVDALLLNQGLNPVKIVSKANQQ